MPRGSNFSPFPQYFPQYFQYIFLSKGVELRSPLQILVVQIVVFLRTTHLICRSTDISKFFRGSLRFRDNESRLYLFGMLSLLQISIADVAIYTLIEFFKLKDNLGSYPKIAASNKKVEENRNIAKYLRERPAAAF